MPKLTDHKILVFDVYGTLVDWETGLFDAMQPLLKKYPVSATWGRKEALTAFGAKERELQAREPGMLYSDVLANAHKALEERLMGLSGKDGEEASGEREHQAFANSIQDWLPFVDTCEALDSLSRHFTLVVLSNVDRESFKHTHARLSEVGPIDEGRLELYGYPENNPNRHWFPQSAPDDNRSPFALVLTAEDVEAYKPAHAGFKMVLRCVSSDPRLLGQEGKSPDEVKEKVLVVAQSLYHDHKPARELGIRSVWIDRQEAVTCNEEGAGEGEEEKWTWRFTTLQELAEAVDAEVEGEGKA
ncbi:hypothetical protein AMATHDRAFT_64910 [Amanita thiersii Skay4041]|uniref:Haloacid dehalogenase n=1 Tax=Amanita thiersii Skay4041 TaxID=703135 RepID=A0A2A9NLV6_9AGAR|nr:hypothetical protein AMATHDRAFT_64910 [Amanita thiersii Skay4041]